MKLRLPFAGRPAAGPEDAPGAPQDAVLRTGDGVPLPERFLEEAQQESALTTLRERLPGKLQRIGDSKLVGLAKEAYGYATHPAVSTRHRALAVGSLLYLLAPVDAVSDFIPGLGYVDDAAVLAALVMSLREGAKEVVEHAQEAASQVASQAISEARESWAERGVAQVCLSLWAATAAACVGLLYTGATASLQGGEAGLLRDPFFWACMLSGGIGLVYQLAFAARVFRRYRSASPETQERLAHAIVSLADWRQVLWLSLPVLALLGVLGARVLGGG